MKSAQPRKSPLACRPMFGECFRNSARGVRAVYNKGMASACLINNSARGVRAVYNKR
jgi:hypothetical protein